MNNANFSLIRSSDKAKLNLMMLLAGVMVCQVNFLLLVGLETIFWSWWKHPEWCTCMTWSQVHHCSTGWTLFNPCDKDVLHGCLLAWGTQQAEEKLFAENGRLCLTVFFWLITMAAENGRLWLIISVRYPVGGGCTFRGRSTPAVSAGLSWAFRASAH